LGTTHCIAVAAWIILQVLGVASSMPASRHDQHRIVDGPGSVIAAS
jgi:hypothetical protein